MNLLLAMQGAVSQGLLWGIMALGVYITYKILNFADMTCDGSFAFGGCVSATLTVVYGWNPFLSLIVAALAGMLAGAVTGILHTKLHIPAILSGILTMISLYSINMRVMGGKSNMTFLSTNTVVKSIISLLPQTLADNRNIKTWVTMALGIVVAIIVVCVMYWFFGTELGCALRATGNNEDMVRALGADTDSMKILGLVAGNALVALSGGLVAQGQEVADVGMGTGAIVIGLASIVIGEVVFGVRFSFAYKLLSVVIGSVIYRIIIAVVLQLGLNTNDMKLLTALIVAAALSLPILSARRNKKRVA